MSDTPTTPDGARAGGERRGAAADALDDAAGLRDGVAGRRDLDADRRDALSSLGDQAAEVSGSAASDRDAGALRRDAEATRRDTSATQDDTSGADRDDTALQRDLAAEVRDLGAARADTEADQRDRTADTRDQDVEKSARSARSRSPSETRSSAAMLPYLALVASDRRSAQADRFAAAHQRSEAAVDRAMGSADRVAGAARRDRSRIDRGTAGLDRETAQADRAASAGDRDLFALRRGVALADRVAGAHDRLSSSLDRDTSSSDRAASSIDRYWSVANAAMELELADSESRAWRLLQAVPAPVVVIDSAGVIERINAQAVALFGYQPDELVGSPVQVIVGADLHDALRASTQAVTRGDTPLDRIAGPSIFAVRKDGTTLPVEVDVSSITLPTGHAVLASIREVSAYQVADAQLQVSDERFRIAFDRAPIGMALIDLHGDRPGRLVQVNPAYCALTGYSEDELLATTSTAITHPDDRQSTETNIALLADGVTTHWDTDKRYIRASGEPIWVHFAVTVVRDAQGLPSYLVSQVHDITLRKSAEAQMAERFHELATHTDVGFMLGQLDPPEALYANAAYLTLMGVDPSGPVPPLADSLAEAHPDQVGTCAILTRTAAGEAVTLEWQLVRADGRTRWLLTRVTPIVDPDGTVRRYTTISEDITARKAAEAALAVAQAEAERANAAKDEFLSRLSHELRTPLNAVLGYAQLLEIDPLSLKREGHVKHILAGGRHLLAMIDDVLDITAIDGDRLTVTQQEFAVAELIADTLPLVQPRATQLSLALHFDPLLATACRVTADPRRLRQVLLNLLSNAVKYNRPGGSVTIEINADDDTGTVDIAVIDTGLGIPEVDLPRLFHAFDRLGRQSTDIEGTGIGLPLSRRLVNLMGGRLEVETADGLGSTFTVTLPGILTFAGGVDSDL